jgi:hypothetical protein
MTPELSTRTLTTPPAKPSLGVGLEINEPSLGVGHVKGDRPAWWSKRATIFLGRDRVGAAAQGTEHKVPSRIGAGRILAAARANEPHCDSRNPGRVCPCPHLPPEAGCPGPEATHRRQLELRDLRGPDIFRRHPLLEGPERQRSGAPKVVTPLMVVPSTA